jgi:hypothetical protein
LHNTTPNQQQYFPTTPNLMKNFKISRMGGTFQTVGVMLHAKSTKVEETSYFIISSFIEICIQSLSPTSHF